MNNFEQDAPLRDELQQIVENLNFILENTKNISPLERDIILQHLRDAYMAVLKLRTSSIIEPAPVVEPEPVIEPTAAEPEPVAEPVVVEPEPVIAEPVVVEPEPVIAEPEPVIEPAATEPEPVIAEPEPVIAESEPVVEPLPTAKPELIIEPSTEPEPLAKSEPIFDTAFGPEPKEEETPDDDILDFLTQPVETPAEEARPEPVKPAQQAEQPTLFPEETETPAPQEQHRSLNDILMEQKEDNSIASNFQRSKIIDLAKSISINDKFLFIKELFRGKGEEFGMAIQKLNSCATLEEAFNEIDIMRKFYFWDTSSQAYLALCDLVRRKFI